MKNFYSMILQIGEIDRQKISNQPVPFPEPEVDQINLEDLGLNK